MDLSNIVKLFLTIIVIVIGIAFIFINLFPILFYKAPVTKSEINKFDAIIVFGYPSTKDGEPSPIMRERVIKAVELFNKGYAKSIICSGGASHNTYKEAEVMAKLVRSLGVHESCVIIEDMSMNTYGNIVNSTHVMKERNWCTAVVVTSPWHLKRSSYLLSKFDITYIMKKSNYPKEFSLLYIAAIYVFENYVMTRNKILFH